MEKIWSLAAAVFVVAAFVFFWLGNFNGVFVTAVLGCLAWLLNYRKIARQRVTAEESENNNS